MKLLVVGIDGLGVESLRGLGLHRLAALIEKGCVTSPMPDNMVSRGWCEIYSGKTAYETGGFFQIPIIQQQRIKATQKTGVQVIEDHMGKSNILWGRLHARDHRVGVFTLPTVNTVQQMCEVTFAATGGGVFSTNKDKSLIYPAHLSRLSNYTNNNLDFRMGRGAFLPRSIVELEAWHRDHLAQYFNTLRQVVERSSLTSLIAGSRFVTQFYKFRHVLTSNLADKVDLDLKEALLECAQDFDYEVTKFITDMSPEHLFVVSDHGLGELKYHVSLNELLRRIGYIDYRNFAHRFARKAYLRTRYSVRHPGQKIDVFPSFDLEHSRAFSIGYTDVIYVNDSRFCGPKMSETERFEVAQLLSDKLQAYVKENCLNQFLSFTPMRTPGWTQPLSPRASPIPLPDIRCHLAQGCVNLGRTDGKVIEKNVPYFASEMFKKGFYAEHSGCKTDDAIAAYVGASDIQFAPKTLADLYGAIINVA